jgi:hypothetical protein
VQYSNISSAQHRPTAVAIDDNPPPAARPPANEAGALIAEPSPMANYRGYIDLVDPVVGLQGWVVNIADPMGRIRLELTAGATVLAECAVDQPRDDVARRYGCPRATPGFCFAPSALTNTGGLGTTNRGERIAVRIAGTKFLLPSARELPSVAEFTVLAQRTAGGEAVSLAANEAPATLPQDISAATQIMKARAARLVELALRPLSENQRGAIEAISVDPAGTVWIAGWMRKGHPLEFPAVVTDRQKYAAAVFLTCYERVDLPDDTIGIFGAVKSEWRPASGERDIFVFFDNSGRFYLRTANPLRMVTGEELLEFFERIKPRCYGRRTHALQRLLAATHSWLPGTARVVGFPVEAWVDHAVVLPEFGCFVEGWILSPVKRVAQLLLRIGSIVLPCDPSSLYFRPRSDLESAYPNYIALTRHAGFVATFLGSVPTEELIDPVLKIAFADGTSSNHPIEPKVISRLGYSARLDDLLSFYPSIHAERFFPVLSEAVRWEVRSAMGEVFPFAVESASRVIVLTVPEDRSDAFLLFAEAERWLSNRQAAPSLVFVAARGCFRSEVVALFDGLSGTGAASHSLFFVDHVDATLYLLPAILKAVAARSFVFVAAGVFLTEAGWRTALKAGTDAEELLEFYEIDDQVRDPASHRDRGSAECFGWSTNAFAAWLTESPMFVDGTANIAPPVPSGAGRLICSAARRSRPRTECILAARIDRQQASERVF